MSVNKLTQNVQFVTDAAGRKRAVLLEVAVWDEIVALLKNAEDSEYNAPSEKDEDAADAEAGIMPALPNNTDVSADLRKKQLLIRLCLREYDEPHISLSNLMDEIGDHARARGLTPEILDSLLRDE